MAEGCWTCYRRNYFQVSSTFLVFATTPSGATKSLQLPCLLEVDSTRTERIVEFYMNISAKPEAGGKPIELIQHTAKRDKGPQEPPKIKFCFPENMDDVGIVDSTVTSATSMKHVTFERLQFRSATLNNGKRRAAQQFHVLTLELYAVSDSGESFKIATSDSPNLIVRGRAPGHYSHDLVKRPKLGGSPQNISSGPSHPSQYHTSTFMEPTTSISSSSISSSNFRDSTRSPEISSINPSHLAFISAVNQLAKATSSPPPLPSPSAIPYSSGPSATFSSSYASSFSPLQSQPHQTPPLSTAPPEYGVYASHSAVTNGTDFGPRFAHGAGGV
jgi:hypothetical protein